MVSASGMGNADSETSSGTLDGKMIDAPVVGKAKSIISKAEVCGSDVKTAMEKWNDQEPE